MTIFNVTVTGLGVGTATGNCRNCADGLAHAGEWKGVCAGTQQHGKEPGYVDVWSVEDRLDQVQER